MQTPACDQFPGYFAGTQVSLQHIKDSDNCDIVMQGKYINDPEVLKESARAAGVEEYERAIQDSSIVLDQVAAEHICYLPTSNSFVVLVGLADVFGDAALQ